MSAEALRELFRLNNAIYLQNQIEIMLLVVILFLCFAAERAHGHFLGGASRQSRSA
jgi:hypothetical protein